MAAAPISATYSIRQIQETEVADVLDVLREVGMNEDAWTLSEEIVKSWHRVDPGAFYAAVNEKGEVLGCCSAVRQNENLVFVGIYAVKPEHQRRGIGTRIWNRMLQDLGTRNAALNSVPYQVDNYKSRGGFPVDPHWCSSYWFSSSCTSDAEWRRLISGISIRRVEPDDLDTIVAYDAGIAGFSRAHVVSTIFWGKQTYAVVAFKNLGSGVSSGSGNVSAQPVFLEASSDVPQKDPIPSPEERKTICDIAEMSTDASGKSTVAATEPRSICGYACVKTNLEGSAVVCPLYADSLEVAEMLLAQLVENFPSARDKGVCLMVSEKNPNAKSFAKSLNFEEHLRMPRLFRGAEVEADFGRVFGQYSLDFAVC